MPVTRSPLFSFHSVSRVEDPSQDMKQAERLYHRDHAIEGEISNVSAVRLHSMFFTKIYFSVAKIVN